MEIKVIRSKRRKKTIGARLVGNTLEVRAPSDISDRELQEAIGRLEKRIKRKERLRVEEADHELAKRAEELNHRYFGGDLRWQTIKYVTNQKRSLGSCTPGRKSIRISDRIRDYPGWVRDYVIVHELAHLVEPNHSRRFWDLVARYPKSERARGFLIAKGMEPDEE